MSELLRDLPIDSVDGLGAGSGGIEVRGVTHDSRLVVPGDLFVAWKGQAHDGRGYAGEARQRGAVAVLSSPPAPLERVLPWLLAEEPRRLLGPLAARLHGHPDRELVHVGVTGTNGKSTVLELLAAILEAAGYPTGRIGTLGYRLGEIDFGHGRTTPEGSDYFRMLRQMRDAGARAAVTEVSSHALEQGRVEGGRWDLGVFTNLTRDHLDYHGDFESYFLAKRRLFEKLTPGGRLAVNVDDPYGRRLLDEWPHAVGFGAANQADVAALTVERDLEGLRGELRTPRGVLAFESPLVGSYNLLNILAAVAGAEALAVPRQAIRRGLAACRPLAGRMELVSRRGGVRVLVDFAHTDAALAATLEAARELGRGRLIVVFGCGGDRDRGKRPLMGRLAGRMSDLAIVTSDNPRSEDPAAIVAEVEEGLVESGGDYEVEIDRRAAIRRAIALADAGTIVLVAGKGHERTQSLADGDIPFSDQEEILAALEERLGSSKAG